MAPLLTDPPPKSSLLLDPASSAEPRRPSPNSRLAPAAVTPARTGEQSCTARGCPTRGPPMRQPPWPAADSPGARRAGSALFLETRRWGHAAWMLRLEASCAWRGAWLRQRGRRRSGKPVMLGAGLQGERVSSWRRVLSSQALSRECEPQQRV